MTNYINQINALSNRWASISSPSFFSMNFTICRAESLIVGNTFRMALTLNASVLSVLKIIIVSNVELISHLNLFHCAPLAWAIWMWSLLSAPCNPIFWKIPTVIKILLKTMKTHSRSVEIVESLDENFTDEGNIRNDSDLLLTLEVSVHL